MATISNTEAAGNPAPAASGLTPLKGLGVLAGVVVAVAVLIGIGVALELSALYAGFLFALYWMGLCHGEPDKFLPALVGALGGLALAWALTALPTALGATAGMAVGLGLVLLAIYALVMGWAPMLVNNCMMLFLTVGSIPALHNGVSLSHMGRAVVVAAVYIGLLVLLGRKLAARGR